MKIITDFQVSEPADLDVLVCLEAFALTSSTDATIVWTKRREFIAYDRNGTDIGRCQRPATEPGISFTAVVTPILRWMGRLNESPAPQPASESKAP